MRPSAVELIDRTILELSRQKIEYAALGSILEGDPGALLFVTFDGDSAAEASAAVERLAALWAAPPARLSHAAGHDPAAPGGAAQGPSRRVGVADGREHGHAHGRWRSSRTPPSTRLACRSTSTVSPPCSSDTAWWPASTVTARSGVCTSVRSWISPDPLRWRRCARWPPRSATWSANSAEPIPASTATGSRAASSIAVVFGDALYAAMCEVKQLFDPDALMNPGKIVNAPPMTENIRDVALAPGARALHAAVVRRHRRIARRGRSMHEHRRLSQGIDRGDVPVVHGHARGGAQHARPRQRTGARAVATGSARRRSATSVCTTSSTSASSARRARASARWAWTWPR